MEDGSGFDDQLQEHTDPADVECRHRSDHGHGQKRGETRPEVDDLSEAMKPYLTRVFPPALLGRIVTIPISRCPQRCFPALSD